MQNHKSKPAALSQEKLQDNYRQLPKKKELNCINGKITKQKPRDSAIENSYGGRKIMSSCL